MKEPASAIKRELDRLVFENIALLNRNSSLTKDDIGAFLNRAARIKRLHQDLDRNKPVPNYTVLKRMHPSPTV